MSTWSQRELLCNMEPDPQCNSEPKVNSHLLTENIVLDTLQGSPSVPVQGLRIVVGRER